jgi:hypothetical protein
VRLTPHDASSDDESFDLLDASIGRVNPMRADLQAIFDAIRTQRPSVIIEADRNNGTADGSGLWYLHFGPGGREVQLESWLDDDKYVIETTERNACWKEAGIANAVRAALLEVDFLEERLRGEVQGRNE